MLRKVLVGLLIALVIVTVGVRSMALTMTIGSGPVALVQTSAVIVTVLSAGPVPATLPAPSTAGTALLAFLGANSAGGGVTFVFPPGWVQLASTSDGLGNIVQVWVYLNNPGGISVATITAIHPNGTRAEVVLSEWANVKSSVALDTSGTAAATSGTTLAPTTTGNVAATREVAISGWKQMASSAGTVTFTTPGGWTRLADNGSDATNNFHMDIEYQLNPATGAPLGPTLTSSQTSLDARGAIVVLNPAPPAQDFTTFLAY